MTERLLQRQDLYYEITFIWLTVYCYECRTHPFQPITAFRKDKMRRIELCMKQWRPLKRQQHRSSPCHLKGMYLQSPFLQCRCYSEYGKMSKGHSWVQIFFPLWCKNVPSNAYQFSNMLVHICNVRSQPSIFMNFLLCIFLASLIIFNSGEFLRGRDTKTLMQPVLGATNSVTVAICLADNEKSKRN